MHEHLGGGRRVESQGDGGVRTNERKFRIRARSEDADLKGWRAFNENSYKIIAHIELCARLREAPNLKQI